MSYKLIRVVVCDAPECATAKEVVQGDDDVLLVAGWGELRQAGSPPEHICPACNADPAKRALFAPVTS